MINEAGEEEGCRRRVECTALNKAIREGDIGTKTEGDKGERLETLARRLFQAAGAVLPVLLAVAQRTPRQGGTDCRGALLSDPRARTHSRL